MSKRLCLRLIAFIGILILFVGCGNAIGKNGVLEIKNGVLDIGKNSSPVELAGTWAFWPNEFVLPTTTASEYERFERFPAAWDSYAPEHFPVYGYGSYAVTLTGLDPNELYALRVPGYSSACRLFVNGVEVFKSGMPGSSAALEKPGLDNAVVQLPSAGLTEVSIVLHLSNFYDRIPASSDMILFGDFASISNAYTRSRLSMIIPFAAILAMGAFFISLFAFHREETSCLWLGLLGLVFAIRIICYDAFIIQDIFPFVSTDSMYRLGYFTFSIGVFFFVGFIRSLYPKYSLRPVVYAIMGVSCAYGLLNLFAPVGVFTSLLGIYQILTLAASVFVLYVLVRSLVAGEEGAVLILSGFFLFFLSLVHDMLVSQRVLSDIFLAHYGIMIIIFCMALIIVSRFSKAFNSVERATNELEKTNASLARFVPNEFLKSLGKNSITEIYLGDNIRKDMCVMFVHLGMDMSLRDSLNRQAMLEILNSVLIKINPVIQRHNGFIDKYLPDGLMVLFPNDPSDTVVCAVEIERIVSEFNDARKNHSLPTVRFAAGIHCGSLMLGTIGDSERMDSTVISDVVNVACRLKQYAVSRDIGIVLSGDVKAALGEAPCGAARLVSLGDVLLKGKDKPVGVFQVSGA